MPSLLLLVVVVLVGSYLWWSQGRRPVAPVGRASADRVPPDVKRWLEAGLLSKEQAEAIASFEEDRLPPRKVPVFAEALGYVGAVLALAGGGAAVGQIWDDLSDITRVSIAATATLVALVAGWLIRSQSEPALQRMMSVLWALSVAGMATTTTLLFVELVELPEDARGVTIGGIAAVYAGALWWAHRGVLQLAAFFGAGLATVAGLVVTLPGEPAAWAIALAVWAYGALWLLLGWRGLVGPEWAAVALGAVVGSWAPTVGAGEHGWLLGVGLVSAALLMAFGVSGRRLPLLAVGALALFGYLTAIVVRYFGDTLGVPTALALVGILVLAAAVALGRGGVFGSGWHRPSGHPAG